jgi:phenylpropionate dioxygenase-like ring-hydroxylating dioxygenase large terminal subunit
VTFATRNLSAPPSTEAIAEFYAGMSQFWHPVATSDVLREKPMCAVQLLGQSLVLARLDGEVHALSDFCRHFQARLSSGEVVQIAGRDGVQCPYHGWSYAGDGRCIRIPQLPPERRIPASARVKSYPVVERYGLYWVFVGDGEPHHALPVFPEWDDPSFRTIVLLEPTPTQASAPRLIMGTLDNTHFPWVHEDILGTRAHPAPPEHRVWRDGQYLRVSYVTRQPVNLATSDLSQGRVDNGDATIQYDAFLSMPNVLRLVKDSAAGRYIVWLATCPSNYGETRNFWAFSRNYDVDPKRDGEYEAFSALVRSQDKPILEGQRPVLVQALNSGVQMPIAPGDTPLVEFIRWLDELSITERSNV